MSHLAASVVFQHLVVTDKLGWEAKTLDTSSQQSFWQLLFDIFRATATGKYRPVRSLEALNLIGKRQQCLTESAKARVNLRSSAFRDGCQNWR